MFLIRFGGDLLSHVLRRSTIGATALNGRVRDGIGCFARAMTTKPNKEHKHRSKYLGILNAWQGHDCMAIVTATRSLLPPRYSNYFQTSDDVRNPSHLHLRVAFEDSPVKVWLLLDQIKPIEQLVPVN